MVNASLNWASIIGIVLAAGGAMLYFMRSFKPALARDYDVFFAAIGLLCGGILFFQGWRLDPILQFGQFLLAGSTVFFAYESVRLRGVTTEQARRASYFEEEESQSLPNMRNVRSNWDNPRNRFDQPDLERRRIGIRDEESIPETIYRRRASSRAVIPERAVSRREKRQETLQDINDWGSTLNSFTGKTNFGERRVQRQETRRGNRPIAADSTLPRSKKLDPELDSVHPINNVRGRNQNNFEKQTQNKEKSLKRNYSMNSFNNRSNERNQEIKQGDLLSEKKDISIEKKVRDNNSQFDD
uniref:Ycf66-like protein n=1 Tax=Paulinella longichromatophora TaxID=1708747 RepID=A0A2H4ZQ33_9EUKA|nr:hypothetical protein PLO_664 [Paulinella longichromatophora]